MKKINTIALLAIFLCIFMQKNEAYADKFRLPRSSYMAVSELKRGMKGNALTVISGHEVISFPIEITGIIPSKGRLAHLILIKASGKIIERTGGIAAGMSGSPVYVGGKLIGAIGYGWDFSDHTIGMVTPIEDMLAVADWPDKIPPFASVEAAKIKIKDEASAADVSSDDVLEEEEYEEKEVSDIEELASPLQIGGLNKDYADKLSAALGRKWIPAGSGTPAKSGQNGQNAQTLKPGSALAIMLAWGDVEIASIGTVSAVEEAKNGSATKNIRKFLAFAHPFLDKGAVAYAAADASVIDVIPSVEFPFKIAATGGLVGMVTQDRAQGVSGYLGKLPPAVAYSIRVKDIDTGRTDFKRFQTVSDAFITAEIAPIALAGSIMDMWGRNGQGTAKVEMLFEGGGLLKGWQSSNYFFSSTNLIEAMLAEFKLYNESIPLNPFQEIRPLGVHLNVELTSEPRVLFIEKIELPKETPLNAGDDFTLSVTVRPWRKPPQKYDFEMKIPEDTEGSCEIMVRGGGIAELQQDTLLDGKKAIESFESYLEELSAKESNNEIIVELLTGNEMKKLKNKKKDGKGDIDDIEEDTRLLSEIKKERLENGTLKIMKTNYYVDGLLRKTIDVAGVEEE